MQTEAIGAIRSVNEQLDVLTNAAGGKEEQRNMSEKRVQHKQHP